MKPVVYTYHDYVDFVKDWLLFLKKEGRPSLSLRSVASRAGLSPAALSLFINKKNLLSEKSFEALLPHLQLNSSERNFLRLLRQMSDAPQESTRMDALEGLIQHPSFQKFANTDLNVYRYLSSWKHVYVHEILQGFRSKQTPALIAEACNFAITKDEVKESLNFLLEVGMIEKLPGQPAYRSLNKNLKCEHGIFRIALNRFHSQMLGLAERAIDAVPRSKRNIQGLTLNLSHENFEKVNSLLEKFLDDVEELAKTNNDKEQEVHHLEFALFPLSSQDNSKGEKK